MKKIYLLGGCVAAVILVLATVQSCIKVVEAESIMQTADQIIMNEQTMDDPDSLDAEYINKRMDYLN